MTTKWESHCLLDKLSDKVHELIDKASKEKQAAIVTALKAILEILK